MSVHKNHVKFFDKVFARVYQGTRRLFKTEDGAGGLDILQIEETGQILLVVYHVRDKATLSYDALTEDRITEMLLSISHAHSHHDKSCRLFEFRQLDRGQIDTGYFLFQDDKYFFSITFWEEGAVTYELVLSKKEMADLEEVLRQALAK